MAVEVEPAHLAQFVGAEGSAPVQHRGVVEHQDFPRLELDPQLAGRILERRHQFGEGLHRHRVLDHLGRPVVLPELDAQRLAVQAEHRLGAALVLAHDGQGVAAQQAEMLGRHAPAQALEGQSGAGQQGLPALPGVAHALQAAQLLRGVEESAVGVQLVLQRRGAEVAADIPRIADRHDAVGVGARVGGGAAEQLLEREKFLPVFTLFAAQQQETKLVEGPDDRRLFLAG